MKVCNSSCNNCRHLDREQVFDGKNAYIELYKYACCYSGEICQYISADTELKEICCEYWQATDEAMIANRSLAIEFEVELDQRLRRWEHVKKYGSEAPAWTDGVSANIIRNQIVDIRNRVEQHLQKADYPKAYYRGVPEELDVNYMARPDSIHDMAIVILQKYDSCEDLQWIAENLPSIPATVKPAVKKRAMNVLAYRQKLEDAIQMDDFVTMKTYLNLENFMEAFRSCREEMEHSMPKSKNQKEDAVQKKGESKTKSAEQIAGQMDLFDYLAA